MKNSKGGKAIRAGSFGCVFRPALKCKGFNKNEAGYISKLISKEDALEEMENIKKFSNILYSIPDNKNFFIPNSDEQFFQCNLDMIDKSNLENSNICTNFFGKESFSQEQALKWIKSNKNYLTIIQQPDGGQDFFNYITDEIIMNDDETKKIIYILINLMINGIKIMNDEGLIHMDIKPDNLVMKDDIIRIIDWGISMNINIMSFDDIKKHIRFYGIRPHNPISNMLFDDNLLRYFIPIKSDKKLIDKSSIKDLLNEHLNTNIMQFFKRIDLFQTKSGQQLLYNINFLTKEDDNVKENFQDIITIMTNYYLKIIDTYYKVNDLKIELDTENFFNEVFRYNIDIYSIFYTFIIMMRTNKIDKKYVPKLKEICYKYMYSEEYAAKRYDINEIESELNEIFEFELSGLTDKEIELMSEKHQAIVDRRAPDRSNPESRPESKPESRPESKPVTSTRAQLKSKPKSFFDSIGNMFTRKKRGASKKIRKKTKKIR